ncbi:CLUMA_CG010673, isoform A [Clunio marinus]|uniref:CLUMA_CG010673, isoform A n=1 Tax=Clunio marinus TaxID=568069 RepID=A0A1J1IE51_9DIPT|nr:CLUMA_CG010673, isoform A [Clunio marinus]
MGFELQTGHVCIEKKLKSYRTPSVKVECIARSQRNQKVIKIKLTLFRNQPQFNCKESKKLPFNDFELFS